MFRPIIRLAAAVLAVILLAVPAQPQSPGSAPTEAHLALARDLAATTGVSQLFDSMLADLPNQLRRQAVTRPAITKDLEEVLEALKPELEQKKQEMADTAARIYANRLTEAELAEILAFFKTPVGRKYILTTPDILDDVAVETQRWSDRVGEFVMARVREEMAKRGHQMQ